ncbi:MAG: translesion DNA synthesis-associated protein ImuA [Gammaproteobacteria bacterium]|jgi:cell division inhibitor SulA/protein ImuA|nr:translesion DNA synthesis-associated protein ImuA [Gammaproteobacteria bacterium]
MSLFVDDMLQQTVDSLLQHPQLWRGQRQRWQNASGIASGHAALDERLPGGGWPRGALAEVLLPCPGIGELQLFLPALLRLSRERRWIALIAPPYIPYAPAWQASGVDLSRLLWIRPRSAREQLWAMEQALRAGTCGAVLCWPDASTQFRELRRLQLAAETGNCMGILFNDEKHATRTTPASLRIRLEPEERGMQVHLIKGGKPHTMRIEGLQVKEAEG